MASLISCPSSGILTAGLAWSLDSDLFAQKSMTNRIGLAYLPATWHTAWRRCVHGQDAEEIQLEDDAEAHGLLEVQAPPEVAGSDADESVGMEELDAGDLAGEVVAEHDPDVEPAGYVGVPAPLEEYKQSVMVWNYDQLSGGKEEVCSSSTKHRHLC